MIVNVVHGKDLITVDFKLRQIRYVYAVQRHGQIEFHDLSHTECDCYRHLLSADQQHFLGVLAEDVAGYFQLGPIDPDKLTVVAVINKEL